MEVGIRLLMVMSSRSISMSDTNSSHTLVFQPVYSHTPMQSAAGLANLPLSFVSYGLLDIIILSRSTA